MKKYIFVVVITFISTLNLLRAEQIKPWVDPVKSVFEIGGSAAFVSMSDYNASLDKIADEADSSGYKPDIHYVLFVPGFDITYASIFQSPIGLWAVTAEFGMLFASDTQSSIGYSLSRKQLQLENTFYTDYFGIGTRKYLGYMWDRKTPNAFIGLNAEIGSSIGNSFTTTAYDTSGNETGKLSTQPNGLFFGGSIEVGGDYWFSENIGVFIKGGFRYLKGETTGIYSGTGIFEDMNTDASKKVLDYSGPYVSAGMTFSLDTEAEKTENDGVAPQLPGVKSQSLEYMDMVERGNTEYGMKNYKNAAEYFEQAMKISPDAGVFRKLGMSYYYLRDKENAVRSFEKYLELNPEDMSMKEWLEKYKK